MLKFGFTEEQTQNALRKLARNRLIETPILRHRETEVPNSSPPQMFHYRVTSVGLYHVRKWICSFSFLDAVSIDTPVFDEIARDKLIGIAGSFNIADRLRKAHSFRTYLEEQWQSAEIGSTYFDFSASVRAELHSFSLVERHLRRTAPR